MDWLNLTDVAGWIRSPGKATESPDGFPMFQTTNVKTVKKKEAGVSGQGSLVLAENVDTIWYVETKDRKTKFAQQDGERFLHIQDELQTQYPELYVRGIMLTSAPLSQQARDMLEENDCLLIQVPGSEKAPAE